MNTAYKMYIYALMLPATLKFIAKQLALIVAIVFLYPVKLICKILKI